ncbi:hypothetical protein GCM10022381_19800 [Leifsonia kafniensis]|uniref:BCCT family transporter n=1 Tax=Leifsonia kafniensis TaxID=475957 RepID=A0ABP7KH73_9MICO
MVKRWVFWPAAVVVVVFVTFALVAPDVAENLFKSIQSGIVDTFNWYYVLITAFFVVFSLFLGFSHFGDIRLGRDDDKPEFSLTAWFSLLFAAGMGIGLVFYGVSEPLSHFANPRPGVTGTPAQLAQQALSQTYLHWGIHAWSIYVIVGLSLAYAIHRRKRPLSIRWALEPLLGKRVQGGWGNAVDVIALVGTLCLETARAGVRTEPEFKDWLARSRASGPLRGIVVDEYHHFVGRGASASECLETSRADVQTQPEFKDWLARSRDACSQARALLDQRNGPYTS